MLNRITVMIMALLILKLEQMVFFSSIYFADANDKEIAAQLLAPLGSCILNSTGKY